MGPPPSFGSENLTCRYGYHNGYHSRASGDMGTSNVAALYFDPSGRIKRSTWWANRVILWVLEIALLLATGPIIDAANVSVAATLFITLVWVILGITLVWCAYALNVKRLHDTDKSAWWMLIALVPFVGVFVLLCILGFQGSSEWVNRYGAKPK